MTDTKENIYSRAKIYKLVNDVDDKLYIGSTTQKLCSRLAGHRRTSETKPNIKVYQHLNECGWESVKIILIEVFPCDSKEQLHARERYYIETLKAELNKIIPTRTHKEYYQDNKEIMQQKSKKKYEDNKESILAYQKEYRENHKEETKEYQAQYKAANREDVLDRMKKWRQNNKETVKENDRIRKSIRFTCACGSSIRAGDKYAHDKTQKHTNHINNQIEINN